MTASVQTGKTLPIDSQRLAQPLLFTFVCHGLAMLAMALVLMPMLPGGGISDEASRVALIAQAPWRWRAGWFPWHVTALSDLWLAAALLRARCIPKWGALASLLLTLMAVFCDQSAQVLLVTRGVELAQAGELARYLAFEARFFPLTSAWAALLYSLAAIAWSVCFARARMWTRGLTWLSAGVWSLFLVVSIGPLLPRPYRLAPELVAAGNALGFLLLELWTVWVAERVLRAGRPDTPHGRYAPWRSPQRTLFGRALEWLANARCVRGLLEPLPVLEFRSDIEDVIYVNYLVRAEQLASYVPAGLELQRLGEKKEWALFTFLTYRHRHFGPRLAGPFRALFPSPVQTNWRTYVRDPKTGKEGIYFVTNALTTKLHALGARLMSEGMPAHLLARGEVVRDENAAVRVTLDPGQGSAPDAELMLQPCAASALGGAWRECFADWQQMLAYCVPQDRAMSTQPWRGTTTRHEIALGIPLTSCEPLAGQVRSQAARAIVGDAEPLCFRVPRLHFRLLGEERDAG